MFLEYFISLENTSWVSQHEGQNPLTIDIKIA